jgi:gliding-associated putative ABC transporter substrate-binding component GldG
MSQRSLKSQGLLRAGIVLLILILLNIISVRVFSRLDFTDKKLFTLSDASKQLVGSLDDKLTVRVYFTEDLPSPYNNHRRAVLDQLNEYKAYSKGNLQYEFIDPTGDEGERDAQQQGVAPVQVQVVKEDQFEAKRAYMGLVFLYEDKKEVMPLVQNMASLEYDISATIKRLTSSSQKKIGFLTGHGEPDMQELTRVQQALGRQYQLTTVDASSHRPVEEDIAALVVMAPKNRIPDAEQYEIDQYLMRGGKVAFLLNRVDADLQQRFGREVNLGVDDLLASYGLRLNADLVRDTRCASVSIVQQSFGFNIQSQVPFPLLPLISNFNRDNMMVKDLKGMVLFFASSVDTTGITAKELQAEVLLRSSKESGRVRSVFMINPLMEYSPAEFGEKEIPLSVLVSGAFTSAFANKAIPVDTSASALPPAAADKLAKGQSTRIVLVGDGDFVRDQYMGNTDNLTFFANMIDYLVDDAGLITIRSKDVTVAPLDQVSDGAKSALKYGNLVAPSLLVLGYGFIRWRVRQAQRKALELR